MGMYKEVIKNCTKLLKNSTENLGWYCTKVTASEDDDVILLSATLQLVMSKILEICWSSCLYGWSGNEQMSIQTDSSAALKTMTPYVHRRLISLPSAMWSRELQGRGGGW
ncbi:hypothetical protein DD238_003806 [Peronospora effusa]|uniref:Uncharacterized protein n=1 Tax=Peronospora effusa TaxID=542832 RepID=A0A3M6VK91_9STRA|nr:hypothetical protein DD238_003806 [Peronospora effusa]RQM13665.1 hypothetical protein DD237_003997 [Peronospora effusa]